MRKERGNELEEREMIKSNRQARLKLKGKGKR